MNTYFQHKRLTRLYLTAAFGLILTIAHPAWLAEAQAKSPAPTDNGTWTNADFHDAHFHLTNYVQEGTDIHDLVKMMGSRIGRSTLFGIPLQQQWSYSNTGDWAPDYYLQTDARRSLRAYVNDYLKEEVFDEGLTRNMPWRLG